MSQDQYQVPTIVPGKKKPRLHKMHFYEAHKQYFSPGVDGSVWKKTQH